jgi:hypothetical protein
VRYVVMCGWSEVPHLSPTVQAELLRSIPPHQKSARTAGVPALGSGVIYPVAEDDIRIRDFPLPSFFRRGYAMDTGWNWTVAVWFALDLETDVAYITHVYKRAEAPSSLHAAAIKARGEWMKGVGDAASINVEDGEQLIKTYKGHGLDIELPDKSVETGIQDVWERLVSGRLRVFASCAGWFEEFRLYRRDAKGKIVKVNDHYMDATRYGVRSGLKRFTAAPVAATPAKESWQTPGAAGNGWMR